MVRLTLLLVSSREEWSSQWDAEFPREGTLISTYAEQTPRWLSGGPALMALTTLTEIKNLRRGFEVA